MAGGASGPATSQAGDDEDPDSPPRAISIEPLDPQGNPWLHDPDDEEDDAIVLGGGSSASSPGPSQAGEDNNEDPSSPISDIDFTIHMGTPSIPGIEGNSAVFGSVSPFQGATPSQATGAQNNTLPGMWKYPSWHWPHIFVDCLAVNADQMPVGDDEEDEGSNGGDEEGEEDDEEEEVDDVVMMGPDEDDSDQDQGAAGSSSSSGSAGGGSAGGGQPNQTGEAHSSQPGPSPSASGQITGNSTYQIRICGGATRIGTLPGYGFGPGSKTAKGLMARPPSQLARGSKSQRKRSRDGPESLLTEAQVAVKRAKKAGKRVEEQDS